MIDETTGPDERSAAPEGQTDTGERVAFCQQCGTGLTGATMRRVGAAVYCEPCLVARLEAAGSPAGTAGTGAGSSAAGAGWAPVGGVPPVSGAVPPVGGAAAPAPVPNAPSPWLAAFLGLIPGVGAMYNGQYAKGVAHLVIFAVVDTLQNNVNGIFSILVAAWVIYQMIDAYQTAKARRDGTALPNAFGLNDIGDRMGFGRNWPGSSTRPVTGSTTAGWASAAAGAATAPPPPGATGPGWTGYVPPTNFGATATPPPVPPPPYAEPSAYAQSAGSGAAAAQGAAWTQAPYVNTYAGEPWASAPGGPVPPLASIAAVPPSRRFPVGAAWLIGLGLIFLLTNLNADWRLNGAWIAAITLGALGSWMLYRRVEMVRAWAKVSGDADAADAGI
ncbi:MAG TPA: hypothetical protein VGM11_13795, partial [Acidobacteriaceae bacterium]